MSGINPNAHHFSQEDRKKIKYLIEEGVRVKQETELLKDGLKDAVKDVSEQIDVPVSTLNKAINIAFKGTFHENQDEMGIIEELLDISGKSN